MTAKDFAKQMRKINKDHEGDIEVKHSLLDDLLCQALVELDPEFKKGINVFNKADKYYS